MKKLQFLVALIAVFFFLFGFTAETLSPHLKRYAIVQIEGLSKKYSPVRFLASDIEISLLPLSISLTGIRTKIDVKQVPELEYLSLGEIGFRLNWIPFVDGRFELGRFFVNGIDAQVQLGSGGKKPAPTPQKKKKPLDAKKISKQAFEALFGIPVQRIDIGESRVRISDEDRFVQLEGLELHFANHWNYADIRIEAQVPALQLKDQTLESINILIDASVSPDQIQIQPASLQVGKSHLEVKAHLQHDHFQRFSFDGDISTNLFLDLKETRAEISKFTDEVPPLGGQLRWENQTQVNRGLVRRTDAQISGLGVLIDDIALDAFGLQANYQDNKLTFEKSTWHPKGASVSIDKIQMDFLKNADTEILISIKDMDLPEFLVSLGVKRIPIDMFVNGQLSCLTEFLPKLKLSCDPKLKASGFQARTGSGNPIVAVEAADVQGTFNVSEKDIRYRGELRTGDSKIASDGVIDFQKGFVIHYSTPRLHLDPLKEISGIPVSGHARVTGSVRGDLDDATVGMKIKAKDLYLKDYYLGEVRTPLNFAARKIKFRNIRGVIDNSRYRGALTVDLDKQRLSSKITLPFFEARSVVKSVSRHIPIPFEFTGSGEGELSFEGPFQFNRLSYQLRTTLLRGKFAGETYDRMHLDLDSERGEVKIVRGQMVKGSSVVEMKGTMNPEFFIDLMISGQGLRLEESENINQVTSTFVGELNFVSEFQGLITEPTISLKGSTKDVQVADEAVPSSLFSFKFGKEAFSGSFDVMGNRVKGQFTFPLTEGAPFRLVAESHDWDFASLLSVLGGQRFRGEYETNLTGKINLVASLGGIWKSTGDVEVEEFLLRRGNQRLANPKPMKMHFSQGVVDFNNWQMQGDQNVLKVEGKNVSRDDLSMNISGRTDMRLLHIFTPFLQEIGGPINFAFKLGGPLSNPQVLGSAYTEDSYIKVFGLQHPFEHVKSDITFSQSRILVNSLTASFAKGQVVSQGHVDIKGFRDIPVKLNAEVQKVQLEIPKGVQTKGNGQLKVTGNWFPYLLSGEFVIDDGNVEMEFESAADPNAVKQSRLLPSVITQDQFDPLNLDIETRIKNRMRLKNSLTDGYVTGNLRILRTPTNPLMKGQINLTQDTLLLFNEQQFTVNSAKINFDDPDEINPKLYIDAQTTLDDYEVNLIVQGTATEPLFRLTSQPPLAENDIISLLALGVVTTENQDTNPGVANTNENQRRIRQDLIGVIASQNAVSRQLKEQLGVEVKFSTEFVESAEPTQRVILSKDFSPKLTASASQPVGAPAATDVRVRYKLNKKMSVVGRFEGQRQTLNEAISEEEDNRIFGLDLEYRVEFK